MISYAINRLRLVVATLCAILFLAGCGDDERQHILKVYNWGDYIDEDLIAEFEVWYKENTGEDVMVIYQTFDINEVMLAKIENGGADFDVVCPSEYIIERMLAKELLQPVITEEFLSELDSKDINYLNCVSPYIREQFALLEAPEGINPLDYAVGYMWGTTGILYNCKYVEREDAETWALMFDERLRDKILVKDAFRDVYSPILIYAKTLMARESGELGEDELLPLDYIRELMYEANTSLSGASTDS